MAGRDIGTVVLPDAGPQDLPRGVGRGASAPPDRRSAGSTRPPPRRPPSSTPFAGATSSTRPAPSRRSEPPPTPGSSRPTATASRTRSTRWSTPSATPRRVALPNERRPRCPSRAAPTHERAARSRSRARSRRSSPLLTTGGRVFGSIMGRVKADGRDRRRSRATGRSSSPPTTPRTSTRSCIGSWLMPRLGRRIHWLGKKELFAWPIVGWAAANGGVHPVDRGAADVEAFRLAPADPRRRPRSCSSFPRARAAPTARSRRRATAIAVLALRTGAPIVPIGIAGSNRVWPKGQKLPHPGGHVTIRVGRAVPAGRRAPAPARTGERPRASSRP